MAITFVEFVRPLCLFYGGFQKKQITDSGTVFLCKDVWTSCFGFTYSVMGCPTLYLQTSLGLPKKKI